MSAMTPTTSGMEISAKYPFSRLRIHCHLFHQMETMVTRVGTVTIYSDMVKSNESPCQQVLVMSAIEGLSSPALTRIKTSLQTTNTSKSDRMTFNRKSSLSFMMIILVVDCKSTKKILISHFH